MSRIFEIKDVPESELEDKMNMLRQDGANEVTSAVQDDGLYTITAVYPD